MNNKSCEHALSLCTVTFCDARCAPFLRPDHNQRVGSLMFRRQRVDRHEEKLDWNNTPA